MAATQIANRQLLTGSSMAAVSAAINTTETILLQMPLPANFLKTGTSIKVEGYGTCTSTAANASNIRCRLGTAGTVADAVVAVITPTAAASGVSIPFHFTLSLTIRTTGAAGTMAGNGNLDNNGVTGITSTTNVIGTPTAAVAVNTTVANTLSLTYSSAAVTTTSTFQLATVQVVKI